jgi:hypothetical protein
MELAVRKLVTYCEDILVEGGKKVPRSHRIAGAAIVITNPWHGRFVDDLKPAIRELAPKIGDMMVPRLLYALGEDQKVEAYGKAAIVGLSGEVEHASALIHTLYFGNKLREEVAGTAFLSFTNKRAAAGASIDIPLKHITKEGARSHFLTASFAVPDAPAADEIVVALGVANSGRPHNRIGDRFEDMKELGLER